MIMGEAKRRGTFEQRREQAINAGRVKRDHTWRLKCRKFDDVFRGPEPPKESDRPKKKIFLIGGTPVGLAVKGMAKIKQPGDNRKEHKAINTDSM
jgi:hypothetical protein